MKTLADLSRLISCWNHGLPFRLISYWKTLIVESKNFSVNIVDRNKTILTLNNLEDVDFKKLVLLYSSHNNEIATNSKDNKFIFVLEIKEEDEYITKAKVCDKEKTIKNLLCKRIMCEFPYLPVENIYEHIDDYSDLVNECTSICVRHYGDKPTNIPYGKEWVYDGFIAIAQPLVATKAIAKEIFPPFATQIIPSLKLNDDKINQIAEIIKVFIGPDGSNPVGKIDAGSLSQIFGSKAHSNYKDIFVGLIIYLNKNNRNDILDEYLSDLQKIMDTFKKDKLNRNYSPSIMSCLNWNKKTNGNKESNFKEAIGILEKQAGQLSNNKIN